MEALVQSAPPNVSIRARASAAERSPAAERPEFEALIIGAGFGGMGAAIQLRRLGIESFLIVDRNADVGGTWFSNRYPGLAVDIRSVTYSYSFELNPSWSRDYAPGTELQAYAQHVAEKYGLREHLRLNCSVERARFDAARNCWTVFVAEHEPLTARVLIVATGYLSQPKWPDVPGLSDFAGKLLHTADWDDSYDLRGRRAAVIGTGASSVQLLPAIAPQLAQLDVYQRTPIWVAPKRDREISPRTRRLFARLPILQQSLRALDGVRLELMVALGLIQYGRAPIFSKFAELGCRRHLARSVPDRALRKKLTPRYGFGCKRPALSNDYYRVFTRANVELVTQAIDRVEPDGIVTRDGQKRFVDTLVLATGFDVWGGPGRVAVYGRGGVELSECWKAHGFQAYAGTTIPGFPNLFYLPSPYSYTGLCYFNTIEGQMRHIARCLVAMQRKRASRFEVDAAKSAEFLARMRRGLRNSVFVRGTCTGANSYYFDPRGEPSLLRPTTVWRAHYEHAHFAIDDYHFS